MFCKCLHKPTKTGVPRFGTTWSVVRIDSRSGICVEQSAAWRSSLDPITGTYQEEVKTSCRQPAELRKQVRAFREYDQKSVAAARAARQSARALR